MQQQIFLRCNQAAVAIPAYLDYTVRSQISEGLSLVSGAKTVVNEYYMNRGSWPAKNVEAGLSDEHDIIGNYTEHVSIIWTCASAGVIQAKHLPTVCR